MRVPVCGGVASRDTLTGGAGGGWNLEEAGGGAIFKASSLASFPRLPTPALSLLFYVPKCSSLLVFVMYLFRASWRLVLAIVIFVLVYCHHEVAVRFLHSSCISEVELIMCLPCIICLCKVHVKSTIHF